jgi:DivIVA domain-containing protein
MGVDETSLDRIRNATFPSSRRGYDKHEVEKFLGRLADWLETGGGDESRSDAVKKELEKVGQRTGAILSQAEESAQQIRAEAEEEARGTINSANLQSTETRTETENYANEARAAADRQAREAIESAEARARQIVEHAEQRREDMEALIGDLIRRREDVIADTEELTHKLRTAVEQHRSGELSELPSAPESEDRAAAETQIVPESAEMPIAPESDEMPVEADSDEMPVEAESDEMRVEPEPDTTERDVPPESQETEEHDVTEQPRPEHQDLRT